MQRKGKIQTRRPGLRGPNDNEIRQAAGRFACGLWHSGKNSAVPHLYHLTIPRISRPKIFFRWMGGIGWREARSGTWNRFRWRRCGAGRTACFLEGRPLPCSPLLAAPCGPSAMCFLGTAPCLGCVVRDFGVAARGVNGPRCARGKWAPTAHRPPVGFRWALPRRKIPLPSRTQTSTFEPWLLPPSSAPGCLPIA